MVQVVVVMLSYSQYRTLSLEKREGPKLASFIEHKKYVDYSTYLTTQGADYPMRKVKIAGVGLIKIQGVLGSINSGPVR